MDEDRVLSKIAQLEEYLDELGQFTPPTKQEFINSRLTQRAVERVLQLAIECVIDIGFMLVKEFNLGPPRDEDNIFQLLEGRVSHIERLQGMKRFRNILVQKYGEVDPKKVYQVLTEEKQDFFNFIADVKNLHEARVREWLESKGIELMVDPRRITRKNGQ